MFALFVEMNVKLLSIKCDICNFMHAPIKKTKQKKSVRVDEIFTNRIYFCINTSVDYVDILVIVMW